MENIYLRALNMNDLEYTHKWHSDQELYKTLIGSFRYVGIDAEREWLQSKSSYSTQEVNLMICLRENGQPIGMISIRDIDWINRKGNFTGLIIGEPQFQGKGYGSEALNLLLTHFFEDMSLNRIWAYAFNDNKSSLRMMEKCGFKVEGQLRQHTLKDGKFKDVVLLGLCADDYFND